MGRRSRGDEGNSADAAELRTRNAALNRMVCEDCGTVYFSAAARTMVERGERCPKCGGRLVLATGPRPLGPRERCEHSDPPAGSAA
jgi:DNA-directed RNA polymerase subunit RPC12/RpoP